MTTYNVYLESPDGLGRICWSFLASLPMSETGRGTLRLIGWGNEVRETKRHKWRMIGKRYNAYKHQGQNAIPPEPPAEVIEIVKRRISESFVYTGKLGGDDA